MKMSLLLAYVSNLYRSWCNLSVILVYLLFDWNMQSIHAKHSCCNQMTKTRFIEVHSKNGGKWDNLFSSIPSAKNALPQRMYSVFNYISYLEYFYIFGLSQIDILNMPNINLIINNWTIHRGTSWERGHPRNGTLRSQAFPVPKMPPPLSISIILK